MFWWVVAAIVTTIDTGSVGTVLVGFSKFRMNVQVQCSV
jgi:hypothetical protein